MPHIDGRGLVLDRVIELAQAERRDGGLLIPG